MADEFDPFGFGEEGKKEEDPDVIPVDVDVEERVPGETDDQHKSRLEKKKERGELRRELEERRDENKRMREEIDQLRGGLGNMHQALSQQGRPQVDDLEVQIQSLYQVEDDHRRAGQFESMKASQEGKPLDPAYRAQWEQKNRQIERRRQELVTQKAIRDQGLAPSGAVVRDIEMNKHADVLGNEAARHWATGRWYQLRAEGMPDNAETTQLAMDAAREKYGLQRRRQGGPTNGERARYSGAGRGAAAGGEGTPSVRMTPELKSLARARYPQLSEREAELNWVKNHGQKYAETVEKYTGLLKKA